MKYVVEAANNLRERKKARTREAIIDAALDLFARQGFEATTIEEIAAAADVSPRTFFRYFDSKAELVLARNAPHDDNIGDLVAARPPEEGPLEALLHVTREKLGERMSDPSFVRELQVMMTTPALRNLAREQLHDEKEVLARAFADRMGVDEGDLRACVLAEAASAAVWAVADRWIAERGDVDRLLAMLDEAFALLADGAAATLRRPSDAGA